MRITLKNGNIFYHGDYEFYLYTAREILPAGVLEENLRTLPGGMRFTPKRCSGAFRSDLQQEDEIPAEALKLLQRIEEKLLAGNCQGEYTSWGRWLTYVEIV